MNKKSKTSAMTENRMKQRNRIGKMSPSTSHHIFSAAMTNKRAMQSNSSSSNNNSRSSITSKRNFDGYSNQNKAKLSITTGKCSSINPYRIFILLVIGFPGLNNGESISSSLSLYSIYLSSVHFLFLF